MPPEASPLDDVLAGSPPSASRGSCAAHRLVARSSALAGRSTTRPVSSTYACRAAASASAAFCSTTTIVVPPSFSRRSASKISRTTQRREAERRLVERAAAAACAIIARPSASICCSPPDSVPACCVAPLVERGKNSKTRARSRCDVPALRPGAEPQVVEHRQGRERAAPLGHVGDAAPRHRLRRATEDLLAVEQDVARRLHACPRSRAASSSCRRRSRRGSRRSRRRSTRQRDAVQRA